MTEVLPKPVGIGPDAEGGMLWKAGGLPVVGRVRPREWPTQR